MLDGVDLSTWREKPDPDDYHARIQKGEAPLWKFIGRLYPDGDERDEVCGLVCQAISVNQDVYMELGIRLGAKLVLELFQSDAGLQEGER